MRHLRDPFDGRRGGLALGALLALCLGCGSDASPQPKLLLYCGAGIRPPVDELAKEFGRRHGVSVECDYDGSERLLARMKLSGRGDLYMPGDVHYVEMAAKQGLVSSRATVCYFVPVILVAKGNPKEIRSLADLTRPDVRVGLGDPEACAIGRKSRKIFAKNGLSEDDMNVAFRGLTVTVLGDHIRLGTLDAVIVWDAVAAYFADVADVVPIARRDNVISTVAVGVLKTSEHPQLAEEFAKFITSEEGRAFFEKHHYATTLPP